MMKYIFLLLTILMVSCSLAPGGMPNVQTDYNYTINWTVQNPDSYFAICSIDYLVMNHSNSSIFTSSITNTNYALQFNSDTNEYPFIIMYSDDGVTTDKKYMAIIKATSLSQTLTPTLYKIGNTAIHTGSSQITVSWLWSTTYPEVRYIIRGYGPDNVTVVDTEIVNTTDLSKTINSSLKYDISLNIYGKTIFLIGGSAS